jgi:hypothetical protein
MEFMEFIPSSHPIFLFYFHVRDRHSPSAYCHLAVNDGESGRRREPAVITALKRSHYIAVQIQVFGEITACMSSDSPVDAAL